VYVASLYEGTGINRPDFIAVVDVDPESPTCGQIVHRTEMPNVGDELHHFGWNACSSAGRGREGLTATLRSAQVRGVLDDLHRRSEAEDPPAVARMRDHEPQVGKRVYGRERAAVYGAAPLSIKPEVGELLYVLALARRPGTIVEFGGSPGTRRSTSPRRSAIWEPAG
jgi:56kDa selenium binding protein (SBP56)